ncbi:MAG: azurin, partial [Xanthomonadales bacterium]|nr:azurin [Xanthomonadales bacterium]
EAYDDASAAVQDAYDDASAAAKETMDEAGAAASEAVDDAEAAATEAMDDVSAAAEEAADDVKAATAAAMGAAGATAAAAMNDGDDCTLGIEVGDNISYSTDSMTVPATCSEVTVTITHTGQLPAVAMGHNWVLLPEADLNSIAQAATAAGADAGYVPDDDRIVAATGLVGGGESDSVTFSLDALEEGVTYRYVCTFPGHWAVMQGSFTVSG